MDERDEILRKTLSPDDLSRFHRVHPCLTPGAAAVFFLAFSAYLYTSPPDLAPYRDAGEMATSAWTLGVSHPPSYPLYILLGHAADELPVGSPARRLTLLSCLCAAAALAVLWSLLGQRLGPWPAAGACLWLGANATFWSVAVVAEMYALTLLAAAGLLWGALRLRDEYRPERWDVFVFSYALALGNRTDLILWAPGLLWLALGSGSWRTLEPERRSWWLRTSACAALGLSVYLYLPLRSSAGPWLDWNHPSELANLIGSLTRRSYGGTLDLLSKSYETGAMFGENLQAYAVHLARSFLGLGLWLPLLGAWAWWRRDRGACLGLGALWTASGPVFLFLANLPPNPHAMAIVEPHYLLPDLALAVLAAEGLRAALAGIEESAVRAALAAALCALPLARRHPVDRRWDLFAYDYSRNVLRSLPPGAALIAKKDVQLFSLWYAQTAQGLRPDARLVAQGLAGSPWYQGQSMRDGSTLRLSALRDAAEWRRFAELNGDVYATTDAEFPEGLAVGPARGLVVALSTSAAASDRPWESLVRRGDYRYEAQPAFFESDLVDAYVQARQRLGAWQGERGLFEESIRNLLAAWTMKWLSPEVPVYLGFDFFRLGRLDDAAAAYSAAARLFDETIDLTRRYRSLPGVADGVRRGASEARAGWGVVLERLKDPSGAEREYRLAALLDPKAAQPHYNLAVLKWNKDWPEVVRELEEAARLGSAQAAQYLPAARAKLAVR